MTIAFDFDGTFAAAPTLFRDMALIAQAQGHTIVMVTGHSDTPEERAEVTKVVGDLMPVVFAGDSWKSNAAKIAGFKVDVWIDDAPQWIKPQQRFS